MNIEPRTVKVSELIEATQYWTRVRPLLGPDVEQWSDPATRVAPV